MYIRIATLSLVYSTDEYCVIVWCCSAHTHAEQTIDHVLTVCPIHRAAHGAQGLTVLDDETQCWLNNTTANI